MSESLQFARCQVCGTLAPVQDETLPEGWDVAWTEIISFCGDVIRRTFDYRCPEHADTEWAGA